MALPRGFRPDGSRSGFDIDDDGGRRSDGWSSMRRTPVHGAPRSIALPDRLANELRGNLACRAECCIVEDGKIFLDSTSTAEFVCACVYGYMVWSSSRLLGSTSSPKTVAPNGGVSGGGRRHISDAPTCG
jgi:hypothetical protein